MGKVSNEVREVETVEFYSQNIGKKVHKFSLYGVNKIRPFKSGQKINTIKGVMVHPITGRPAYTFEEDDSHVEAFRCKIAEDEK